MATQVTVLYERLGTLHWQYRFTLLGSGLMGDTGSNFRGTAMTLSGARRKAERHIRRSRRYYTETIWLEDEET